MQAGRVQVLKYGLGVRLTVSRHPPGGDFVTPLTLVLLHTLSGTSSCVLDYKLAGL